MRALKFLLFVFALFLLPTTQAEAARGGFVWGSMDQMHFVAETPLVENGQPLALCHLTRKYHLFFAGFWRTNDGYVLTENNCDSDYYYSIDTTELRSMMAAGELPEDLPIPAQFSASQWVGGFWGIPVALVLIVLGIMGAGKTEELASDESNKDDTTG